MTLFTGTNDGESITGTAGDDQIDALGGNDILDGGAGADIVNGGDGGDLITLSDTLDTIDGGADADALYLGFSGSSVGITIDLTALWSGGVGTMSSSLGSGTIVNMEGIYLFSTEGSQFNDTITFGDIAVANVNGLGGDDTINGGSLNDGFNGGSGNDTLNGGGGNDGLAGDSGADIVNGGEGDDYVTIIDTLDTVDGGDGSDTLVIDFSSSAVGITMDLTALWTGGTGTTSSSLGSGTIVHMEAIYPLFNTGSNLADTVTFGDISAVFNGVGGNDTINGGSLNDNFNGGDGNDTLNGGGGNDHLAGDGGADIVNGGEGDDVVTFNDTRDTVDGGNGNDTLYLDFNTSTVGVKLDLRSVWAGGTGTMSSSLGSGTIAHMEGLYVFFNFGSNYNDTIRLGDVASIFDGQGGNDLIVGGKFSDSLYGAAGNDVVSGLDGNDHLYGGDNNDTLTGGRGADILSGGAGNDTFVFLGTGDSGRLLYDTITDFDANADHFDLPIAVTAVETAIVTGKLNHAGFSSQIGHAVGALGAYHAVLFTADSGDLAGHTYLVVDGNGTVGYQAGHDFIVELQGASNLASLGTGSFI